MERAGTVGKRSMTGAVGVVTGSHHDPILAGEEEMRKAKKFRGGRASSMLGEGLRAP
jgi:hypothetical protein